MASDRDTLDQHLAWLEEFIAWEGGHETGQRDEARRRLVAIREASPPVGGAAPPDGARSWGDWLEERALAADGESVGTLDGLTEFYSGRARAFRDVAKAFLAARPTVGGEPNGLVEWAAMEECALDGIDAATCGAHHPTHKGVPTARSGRCWPCEARVCLADGGVGGERARNVEAEQDIRDAIEDLRQQAREYAVAPLDVETLDSAPEWYVRVFTGEPATPPRMIGEEPFAVSAEKDLAAAGISAPRAATEPDPAPPEDLDLLRSFPRFFHEVGDDELEGIHALERAGYLRANVLGGSVYELTARGDAVLASAYPRLRGLLGCKDGETVEGAAERLRGAALSPGDNSFVDAARRVASTPKGVEPRPGLRQHDKLTDWYSAELAKLRRALEHEHGLRIAADGALAKLQGLRNDDDPWCWQGDGNDDLGSMSSAMVVRINADDLRVLVAGTPLGGAEPPAVWRKLDPAEWGHLNDHEDVDPAEVYDIDDESDTVVWMTYDDETGNVEEWYGAVGRWSMGPERGEGIGRRRVMAESERVRAGLALREVASAREPKRETWIEWGRAVLGHWSGYSAVFLAVADEGQVKSRIALELKQAAEPTHLPEGARWDGDYLLWSHPLGERCRTTLLDDTVLSQREEGARWVLCGTPSWVCRAVLSRTTEASR